MNKGYIKVILALLSVTGYMQNIVFASEHDPSANSSNETSTQLLSADPEEAKQAEAIMANVLNIAKKHAKHTKDYSVYTEVDDEAILHLKYVNNTEVGKLEFTIHDPNIYDNVVNLIWDPNGATYFDETFIEGSTPQVYNENLVIIQQRYQSAIGSWQRYYHALAGKFELSSNETAILMASSDMNDHDGYCTKQYVNPIVDSINSFCPDINSQEDIRNGKLSKMFVNLMVFFIKKEADSIKITHISSVDANAPWFVPGAMVRKAKVTKMLNFLKLRDIFKNE
ncbi:fam-a protein [Plasmodium chabaudi adami]|uniref:Fam-a protein n=1 Tax=Plasmodium chabaudi adami TaxID=5826 RepID=A0A1D3L9T4_PLACE|nr:fam-a protein [Plasmodium chabaudi adami]